MLAGHSEKVLKLEDRLKGLEVQGHELGLSQERLVQQERRIQTIGGGAESGLPGNLLFPLPPTPVSYSCFSSSPPFAATPLLLSSAPLLPLPFFLFFSFVKYYRPVHLLLFSLGLKWENQSVSSCFLFLVNSCYLKSAIHWLILLNLRGVAE